MSFDYLLKQIKEKIKKEIGDNGFFKLKEGEERSE